MNFGGIPEIDKEAETAAKGRWDALAKPVGSLGELERLVIRMAGIRGTADLRARRRAIAVFCADNGVTAEGICGSDPALDGCDRGKYRRRARERERDGEGRALRGRLCRSGDVRPGGR